MSGGIYQVDKAPVPLNRQGLEPIHFRRGRKTAANHFPARYEWPQRRGPGSNPENQASRNMDDELLADDPISCLAVAHGR